MDGELGCASLNIVLSIAIGFVALKLGDVIAKFVWETAYGHQRTGEKTDCVCRRN
jgi:hypothetical protein